MADKRIGGQLIEKLELHHLIIAYEMLAGESAAAHQYRVLTVCGCGRNVNYKYTSDVIGILQQHANPLSIPMQLLP